MILIILCYAILASTFTFAKAAVSYAHPLFFIGIRMLVAGVAILFYQRLILNKKIVMSKLDRLTFLKIAFFHIYLPFVLEFWALQYTSSSKTCLIYSLTPFIAAILSYIIDHERISSIKTAGLFLGFGGIIPILLTDTTGISSMLHLSQADCALLIAVSASSYAWFDIKKLMQKGYSLLMINGISMLIGGAGALTTYYIKHREIFYPVSHTGHFVYYIFCLILLSNVIFYNLFGSLINKYNIVTVTTVGFLTPFFASVFGYIFLGEHITTNYYCSLALVSCALLLFYYDEKRVK